MGYSQDTLKGDGGKQRIIYLTILCKYLDEQGLEYETKRQNLLRSTKEWKLRRSMMIHVLKRHSTQQKKTLNQSMFCFPQRDLIHIVIFAYSEKPRNICSLLNNLWSDIWPRRCFLLARRCFTDRLNTTPRIFLYVPATAFPQSSHQCPCCFYHRATQIILQPGRSLFSYYSVKQISRFLAACPLQPLLCQQIFSPQFLMEDVTDNIGRNF